MWKKFLVLLLLPFLSCSTDEETLYFVGDSLIHIPQKGITEYWYRLRSFLGDNKKDRMETHSVLYFLSVCRYYFSQFQS